jgi:hypothetical protein
MKQLGMLVLLTIGVISAQAQNVQQPKPNLDILKFGVRSVTPSSVSTSTDLPGVYTPPEREIEIIRGAELETLRSRPGNGPSPFRKESSRIRNRDSLSYMYHLKARNTDQKTIKRLFWQYASADASTPVRRFGCEVSVKPNQVKKFELASPFPPSSVVNVSSDSKEFVDGQFTVIRIEYADGSVWQRDGLDLSGSPTRGSSVISRKIQKNRCTWL